MKKSSIIIFVFVGLLASACRCRDGISVSDRIQLTDYLIEGKFLSDIDSEKIVTLMDTLLSGASPKRIYQLNKRYDPTTINVYILDGSIPKVKMDDNLTKLVSNCSYIGENIIIIDAHYLETFFLRFGAAGEKNTMAFLDNRDTDNFFYWVVGHELGHLLCGHLEGHFDSSSLEHYVTTSTLDNQQELSADSFFVHAIAKKSKLRVSVETTLIDILNAEIERKMGKINVMGVGLIYDYTGSKILTYTRQPTHPEFVIRLSRMLELSTSESNDHGLHNLIGGFIKQMKETAARK